MTSSNGRQSRVDGRRPRNRLRHVTGDLLLETFRRIRPHAGQAFVEHACQRVDVRRRIDRLALESLGGHVGHRAQRAARRRQPHLACGAGQAEVDQIHEVAIGDQNVRRLDVAVDQTRSVRVIQCRRDLFGHLHAEFRIEWPVAVGENRAQVAALDQAHIQIEPVVDLAESVDRHHMRIVEPGRGLRLPPEPRLKGLVGRHVRGQHLDRHDPVGLGVVGPIDLAHPAAPDQLLQLIVPEWCRVHR